MSGMKFSRPGYWGTTLVLLMFATALGGCAVRGAVPVYEGDAMAAELPPPPAPMASYPDYRLGTGDILQVRFPYHKELESRAVVRPDGQVTVAGLGEFHAIGLTVSELESDIYRRASLSNRDPEVYVIVSAARELRAYIGGEIKRPGFVTLRPGLTSLRAVFERGGFLATAKRNSVVHIRWAPDGAYDARLINLKKVLETGDTTDDMMLGANDVLYVPATMIANANLWVRQYIKDLIPIRPPSTPDIGQ